MRKLVKESLNNPVKPGELRYLTARKQFEAEKNIHMLRDGVESQWGFHSPCSHPCGPYGWITDILLSGYGAIRRNGEIYIYKVSTEHGDVPWKWC